MNNLYNKIYEAINTGIQKALIISDNQSDNISIGWKEKEITSDANLMALYASEILAGNNIEDNYEMILKLYNNHKYTYKAADLKELNKLFKNIKKSGISDIDLTWIDSTNALTVISQMYDDTEYSLHQYDPKTFKLCNLIKFGENLYNPLYIWRFDQIPCIQDIQWHTDEIEHALGSYEIHYDDSDAFTTSSANISDTTDINGYAHTYDNPNFNPYEPYKSMDYTIKIQDYPVFDYICGINVNNKCFKPYLPAISELMICSEYQDLINYVFKLMGNTTFMLNVNGNADWWSSSEYSKWRAWYMIRGTISYQDKNNEANAFPLFKKIKG